MMLASRATLAVLLASALLTPVAYAGRPMMVDDAAIAGAHQCQLESWVQDNRHSTEYWAVPACNAGGNLEVALGGAHITGAAGASDTGVL